MQSIKLQEQFMLKDKLTKLSDRDLIYIMLMIDSLVTHFQGYISSDSTYIYCYLGLLLFHGVLTIIENKLKLTSIVIKLLVIMRGIAQVVIISFGEGQWNIFAGIQIIGLLYLDRKWQRWHILILMGVVLITLGVQNNTFLAIGIVRALVVCAVISQSRVMDYSLLQEALQGKGILVCDHRLRAAFDSEAVEEILTMLVQDQDSKVTNLQTPRDDIDPMHTMHKTLKDQINEGRFPILAQDLSGGTIRVRQVHDHYLIERDLIDIQKKQLMLQINKVSHDMRTPLNAIINMQVCLKDLIDPALTERYLKPSLGSCRLLLNYLNDILDSAQLEHGQIRMIYNKFKLHRLIEKTLQIFDLRTSKKNISMGYSIDKRVPSRINSDKNRVQQILINLISNAVKYTQPNGQIMVHVTASSETRIQIIVQDSGIGIKKENINLLFKDFAKINDRENQLLNPTGVGLGLQICNDLAKALSGVGIQVQSEYGVGSKFSFELINNQSHQEDLSESADTGFRQLYLIDAQDFKFIDELNSQKSPMQSLPLPLSERQVRVSVSGNRNLKQSQFSRNLSKSLVAQERLKLDVDKQLKKVSTVNMSIFMLITSWKEILGDLPPTLIVDDNEFNIVALQYLLESMDVHCDSAMSGLNCLQKAKERIEIKKPYQIIFMDIEMPFMDGLETTKKLHDIDSNIRVVACSAFRLSEVNQLNYKLSGMYAALEKPVKKQDVKNLLIQISEFK